MVRAATAPRPDEESLWYKDAVIYQVHVKSYFDSDNDGVGDFRGLIEKLDYIRDLGVTAIWLLPFYPSPMRDDGYDIADYRNIHPSYGTLQDFRRFIREAHNRGLKVITELVVNHTSDQHPWFQAARRAKRGSAKREFYVWSDTDQEFPETRIIFTDSEESNWAWDPVAQQYYWHRFFSHQPDLNHNNPRVVKAVIQVMRFWFSLGVDGMRLDAIPYLCVRAGTSNENLSETHAVIRQIRAAVDREFPNRMLLAEANQWPEDVREYFGHGDECHMAYHFPLMPRMYMAVALEERHPVVEILEQTPEIPDTCQWVVFLRNHDELTLEMVTDHERDYMYRTYATDPRMRVNVGIRRRLAPLMDNDLGKIQLMNSLLLSMPGSPVLYYGDEIGMGDNFYLGDRNGVRTPMQWSPDRNGDFSRADPQQLFLPPIMDPIYGFASVNVEAQSREPTSLLNWTKRILHVRKSHPAFGRGALELLKPGNRKILAYLRIYAGDALLCVVNLARSAQPVELDLSRFQGRVPVELLGRTPFPPIGELPYLLTLPGHGFFWFELAESAEEPSWHAEHLAEEAPWLVVDDYLESFIDPGGRDDAVAERLATQLEQVVLPSYLTRQRWFAAKNERVDRATLADGSIWRTDRAEWLLTFADATLADKAPQRYFLPLALRWQKDPHVEPPEPARLARVRRHAATGMLYEALADERFCYDVLDAVRRGNSVDWNDHELRFEATSAFERLAGHDIASRPVRRAAGEGSNSTLLVGDRLFVKLYRRIQTGVNPEWEMGRHLTEVSPCSCIAEAAGAVECRTSGSEPATLMLVQAAVANQGDGWTYTLDYLDRHLEDALTRRRTLLPADDEHGVYMMHMQTLAERTAELHRALALASGDEAFDPEPLTPAHMGRWRARVAREANLTFELLAEARNHLSAEIRPLLDDVLPARSALGSLIEDFVPGTEGAVRTRYHGDYHLGQVLLARNDFVITDLEGEPGRTFAERRYKDSALKDVAGMLRSLAYARGVAARKVEQERPSDIQEGGRLLDEWLACARRAFADRYREAMQDCPAYPARPGAAETIVELAELEKLLYEIRYELANRPLWLAVPLADLAGKLGGANR